jgi:hypothetical protein
VGLRTEHPKAEGYLKSGRSPAAGTERQMRAILIAVASAVAIVAIMIRGGLASHLKD